MTRRISVVALAVLVGALSAVSVPASADAASATQIIRGRYLQIDSHADWHAAGAMRSGDMVRWDLAVSAAAPSPGTVQLGVSATGAFALAIDVRTCDRAWRGAVCPAGERLLRAAWPVPLDGRITGLEALPADAVSHLRIDVRVPQTDTASGGSTEIRIHADGFGDSIQAGPGTPAELPATGGSVPAALLLGGGVLVAGAIALILVDRRRRGGGGE